jgi:16S rRNA (cytosine967-C5)-methyltransferase
LPAWCDEPHGPGPLEAAERARLEAPPPAGLPAWVQGNYPEWLAGSFERAFGEHAWAEGAGLSRRAPVDLRVNTLKATRDKVLKALARARPEPGPWSPFAVRIPPPVRDGRTPNVEAEAAHARGWFEVQDAGSQVAALMTAAEPGHQVADVCAGAGGKTLALAAQMANRGQIHAYDADRHRLRPIFDRLKRAGARNVQVIPADEPNGWRRSRVAWTWCWSTPRARARAAGGAGPTPSGGSRPKPCSGASPSRPRPSTPAPPW